MIVAKTNLKKIPKTCNKCKFSVLSRYFDLRSCSLLNNKRCEKIRGDSGNWIYTRLKNCPLVDIK